MYDTLCYTCDERRGEASLVARVGSPSSLTPTGDFEIHRHPPPPPHPHPHRRRVPSPRSPRAPRPLPPLASARPTARTPRPRPVSRQIRAGDLVDHQHRLREEHEAPDAEPDEERRPPGRHPARAPAPPPDVEAPDEVPDAPDQAEPRDPRRDGVRPRRRPPRPVRRAPQHVRPRDEEARPYEARVEEQPPFFSRVPRDGLLGKDAPREHREHHHLVENHADEDEPRGDEFEGSPPPRPAVVREPEPPRLLHRVGEGVHLRPLLVAKRLRHRRVHHRARLTDRRAEGPVDRGGARGGFAVPQAPSPAPPKNRRFIATFFLSALPGSPYLASQDVYTSVHVAIRKLVPPSAYGTTSSHAYRRGASTTDRRQDEKPPVANPIEPRR